MIIEMLQVHSAAEGSAGFIEYVFDKGGMIASFYAKNPPLFTSLFPPELSFEGIFRGRENYKIVAEKINICPDGYVEKKFGFERKRDDGTKDGISKSIYNIYKENNDFIGTIKHFTCYSKRKLFSLPQAYEYQECEFKGLKYQMYDVRIRGTGVFYCIYKDNNLIAMIEKNLTTINWLDNYKIYSFNDVDIDFLCLITSYYDFKNFEKTALEEGSGYNTRSLQSGDATIEWRKEVLDKYDPNFKNKIISMQNNGGN